MGSEHWRFWFNGEINSQFNVFNSLRSLNLGYNSFAGHIPTNLGQMNVLEELELSFNSFTGEIPVEISTRYTNLSLIDLSVNKLTGPIPEQLGNLTKLQTLVLSVNNLTGEIPRSISEITTLVRFAANQNNFNGPIPPWITSHLSLIIGTSGQIVEEARARHGEDRDVGPLLAVGIDCELGQKRRHRAVPEGEGLFGHRVRNGGNGLLVG
ncbi:hypothetical protein CASFOL_012138 [Castilleja foliolosa]|uniref:Uncharacterized protein n=1 Tax=Castilleja foliolosa TaxID=1961234 RepID=A0ABD3DR60_9LAMI